MQSSKVASNNRAAGPRLWPLPPACRRLLRRRAVRAAPAGLPVRALDPVPRPQSVLRVAVATTGRVTPLLLLYDPY